VSLSFVGFYLCSDVLIIETLEVFMLMSMLDHGMCIVLILEMYDIIRCDC
jgi:hypothetical protein